MTQEERLEKLNNSLNKNWNGIDLISDNSKKTVDKLFEELTNIDFLDCACSCDSDEDINVYLWFGEHNRHISIIADDEFAFVSYLGVCPTLGIHQVYYGDIVKIVNELLEIGKTRGTQEGNYYKIVNGKICLCIDGKLFRV